MYSRVTLGLKYVEYYMTAAGRKGHGIHSPFVFDFITNVINDNRHFYAFDFIEQYRENMLKDYRVLEIEDFGAGSIITKSNQRRVRDIAGSALKAKKYGQLMFRIVNYFKLNTIVELGTSLGITTAYLASANLKATVHTFEGAKQVAQIARQNFDDLLLKNIELIEGNFDHTLSQQLSGLSAVDLAFVDGNHRRNPTIAYFEELLEKSTEFSIFIFDDIHWSMEMEEAWKYIQKHPLVKLTVDLFFVGIVFFRKELKVSSHYAIRF